MILYIPEEHLYPLAQAGSVRWLFQLRWHAATQGKSQFYTVSTCVSVCVCVCVCVSWLVYVYVWLCVCVFCVFFVCVCLCRSLLFVLFFFFFLLPDSQRLS